MHLVIRVIVDGVSQSITFRGGIASPRRINGSFATSDAAMQAAIEKHPFYKKKYELVKTINMSPKPAPAKVVEKVPEIEKPEPYVSKAKNAQEARQELNRKFSIKLGELKNSAAILDKAEDFNIVYPDWERP